MGGRGLGLALCAAFALAACMGGARTAAVTQAPPASIDVHRGTGVLAGVVTDEEFRPLADALVHILPESGGASTDLAVNASGGFRAVGLAPARYVVTAERSGYRGEPAKADVAADGVAQVSVVLVPNVVWRPFHMTREFRVAYSYEACTTGAVGHCMVGASTANQTYSFLVDESAQGPLEALVVEAAWQPTVSACPGGMRTDVWSPEQDHVDHADADGRNPYAAQENPFHWDNRPHVASPTRLVIPREGDPGALLAKERTALNHGRHVQVSGAWHIVAWPEPAGRHGVPLDADCMLEQTVTVYATVFHLASPAPAWSVLTDGGTA